MTRYHKISVDAETYTTLQRFAAHIQSVTAQPTSAAMAIRLLACGKLKIKTETQ
jgi:hypothetical protein